MTNVFNLSGMFNLLILGRIQNLNPKTRFIDDPNTSEPFSEYYSREILPLLLSYEKRRIAALSESRVKAIMNFILSITFMLPLMYIIIVILFRLPLEFSLGALLGSLPVTFIYISYSIPKAFTPLELHNSILKKDLIQKVLQYLGSNYSYESSNSTDPKPYSNSMYDMGLFSFNSLFPNIGDKIIGKYKDIVFRLFGVDFQKDAYAYMNTNLKYMVTDSSAEVIHIKMNKEYSGETLIKRKCGLILEIFKTTFGEYKSIKVGNSKLENMFSIYTKNGVTEDPLLASAKRNFFAKIHKLELSDKMPKNSNPLNDARQLLTPSFLEKLLAIESLFEMKKIECTIKSDDLTIKLPVKYKIFESKNYYKPADYIDDIKTLFKEIALIHKLIDELP